MENSKKFDLEGLSILELHELVANAQEQIEVKKEIEYEQKIEEVVNTVRDYKIPVTKLFRALRVGNAIFCGVNRDGKIRKVYFNKKNPLELYDGLGRKPSWFAELEKSNADLADHELPLDNFATPYY